MTIKKGDKIKVEYTGLFEDGSVFDSSEKHGKPLEVEVGKTPLIKGFTDALVGMKKDEEKEITLKPEEAYGDRNAQLIKNIPKDKIPPVPEGKELQAGMMMTVGTPDGQQIPAVITKVDKEEVTIDMNHPLAGRTIKFKIKIADIE